MISRRSKWLIGGFAAGVVCLVVLQVLMFRQLQQLQAVAAETAQMPTPETLQHSTIFRYGPSLLVVFYIGCLFAVFALVSLILDNRRKR
jgi:hypothetical protein